MSSGAGAGAVATAETIGFTRLAAQDRYATAAAIARDGFPRAEDVVLVSGDARNASDALVGTYLAGRLSGPVLLTTATSVPEATRAALRALQTRRVVVVGGTRAVSAAVEGQLRSIGLAVERLAGDDRYATARMVAARAAAHAPVGTVGGRRTAVLGSGQAFADVLAAGPASWSHGLPLLLTRPTALPAPTRDLLQDLEVQHVLVVGGVAAVSREVENEVVRLGMSVTRLQGADRSATAVAIAEFAYDVLGYDDRHVDLARGDDVADGLAGGPRSGKERAPILLSSRGRLSPATRDFLTRHAGTLTAGHVFGGTAGLSPAVEAEAVAAVRSADTSPPAVSAFGPPPTSGATTVRFTSSEPLLPGSVTTGDVHITGGASQGQISAVAVVGTSITVSTSPLVPGNVVVLRAGSVTDPSGNAGPTTPAATAATRQPDGSAVVQARWNMDDNDRTMRDSSGQERHGTLTSNVLVGQPGYMRAALRFTKRPSYGTVPDTSGFDPGSGPFSVTAHVRFSVLPLGGASNTFDIVRKGLSTTPGGDWKLEIVQDGRAHCLFGGSAGISEVYGTADLADGAWHALTCRRTSSGVQLVVDGAVRSSSAASGTISNDQPVVLGVRNTAGDDQYVGLLDEVTISKG